MKKYRGTGGSDGIAVGRAVIIKEADIKYEHKRTKTANEENSRLIAALERFKSITAKMADDMKQRVGEKDSKILLGHIAIADDPDLRKETQKLIESGKCAEEALETVFDRFIDMFSSIPDEMMRQRATDIGDVKVRLLHMLIGYNPVDMASLPPDTILIANDLTPSMTAGIKKENVSGILTQMGGRTSHSTILARALMIPAVLSVKGIVNEISDGDTVIIDGEKGDVFVNPDEETIRKFLNAREKHLKAKEKLFKYKDRNTQTADGDDILLLSNIGSPQETDAVKQSGCEGVGLFRTEFLFIGKNTPPDEEEQFEAYKETVLALGGGTVVIRTLDLGGDKVMPYLGIEKEENPFLGYRAIRFCLDREEICETQLRAILRASVYGDIKIMIPLVTCIDELLTVRKKVKNIMTQLDKDGIRYNKDIEIGVMIETPAASEIADILAKEADFFSIGTNDLTQYTMAADRTNSRVEYLCSAYNIAVLRSIKRIIECADKEGIMCSMCGEAASDVRLIPIWISFGLKELSVSTASVLQTRKTISLWTKAECDELADRIMGLFCQGDIKELLEEHARF